MNPHLLHASGSKLTVWLDGPAWDSHPSATIGRVTCTALDAARDLVEQAIALVRDAGVDRIIGPMDRDTWHSYRLLTQTDGSPAFMMEPPSSDVLLAAMTAAGFSQIGGYFSARVPLRQVATQAPPPNDDFSVAPWDGTDPEGLFAQVHELSTAAFAQNAFYQPISRDDFLALYRPIVPLLKRELIFFARRPDDSLAGFLFGMPNYAEGPQPHSAILKSYASLQRGAGQHLAHAFHTAAAASGYDTAIHALIHDDNLSALRSATEGAEVFRRYGLFGLILHD